MMKEMVGSSEVFSVKCLWEYKCDWPNNHIGRNWYCEGFFFLSGYGLIREVCHCGSKL